MESVMNAFYGMVERGPLGLWAFLAGNVIDWGVMLRLRNWRCARLSSNSQQFIGHIISFSAATLTCWLIWQTTAGIIVGIAVGLWGPFSFGLALLVLEWRWPKAAAWLRTGG